MLDFPPQPSMRDHISSGKTILAPSLFLLHFKDQALT